MSKGINSKNCIKEFSENELLLGVRWYDFGWRMQDPQLGVWHCVDPMAEKYYSLSPYNYVFNNPINVVDPDGRAPMIDNWLRSIYYHQDSGPGMRGGGSYTPGWDLGWGGGSEHDRRVNPNGDYYVGPTKYGTAAQRLNQDRYSFKTLNGMINYVSRLAGLDGMAKVNFVTGSVQTWSLDEVIAMRNKYNTSASTEGGAYIDALVKEGIISERESLAIILGSVLQNTNNIVYLNGNMPYLSQGNYPAACGAAVLGMLHNYFYGTNYSLQDVFTKILGGNTGPYNLDDILLKIGNVKAQDLTRDARKAMSNLNAGIPMVLAYEVDQVNHFFHYSIVVGFGKSNMTYILNDPNPQNGANYRFQPAFNTRWLMFPASTITYYP